MNIFVGSSSRETKDEEYLYVAKKISEFIVNGNHNFVFGGCEYGLMGYIYSIVSKNPGSKIKIAISKSYEKDLENLLYSEVYVIDTVNNRKDAFTSLSDIMFFLPGGIGTIDELISSIESRRCHEHDLPIIIINVNNYFEHLLKMLDRIYNENFADEKNRDLYYVANSVEDAIEYAKKKFLSSNKF